MAHRWGRRKGSKKGCCLSRDGDVIGSGPTNHVPPEKLPTQSTTIWSRTRKTITNETVLETLAALDSCAEEGLKPMPMPNERLSLLTAKLTSGLKIVPADRLA